MLVLLISHIYQIISFNTVMIKILLNDYIDLLLIIELFFIIEMLTLCVLLSLRSFV